VALDPGIHQIPAEEYHADPAVGRTTLWRLHVATPAHAKFQSIETTPEMDIGTATHTALLEPHRFEKAVICGPVDRRGKKWGEAVAANPGALVLPQPTFEKVLRLRDTVMKDPIVQSLPSEFAAMEHSAVWRDAETNLMCKCRPDLYRGDQSMIVDLKTTGDATKQTWLRRAMDFGMHLQASWYSDGWQLAGGGDVETFLFLVVERDPPFAHALYELGPGEVDLGRRIGRKALQKYMECARADDWPGHMEGVQVMTFPEHVYSREAFDGTYTDAA
jgi:hypothetical protein